MVVKVQQVSFYERIVDGERVVYADWFPTYIAILPSVWDSADPDYVVRDGKRVRIRAANGHAVYVLQWEPQAPDQPVTARRSSYTWKAWRAI